MFMFFALYDYKGGFDNFIGLTVFQPIWATIFSIVTIIICFIFGLPIRLNKTINSWWTHKWFIPIILLPIGLIMVFISFTPAFLEQVTTRMEGLDRTDTVPNRLLSISGWFLTAFAALHIYLPARLKSILEKWTLKFKI
jgi:hypothetical protein